MGTRRVWIVNVQPEVSYGVLRAVQLRYGGNWNSGREMVSIIPLSRGKLNSICCDYRHHKRPILLVQETEHRLYVKDNPWCVMGAMKCVIFFTRVWCGRECRRRRPCHPLRGGETHAVLTGHWLPYTQPQCCSRNSGFWEGEWDGER